MSFEGEQKALHILLSPSIVVFGVTFGVGHPWSKPAGLVGGGSSFLANLLDC